MLQAIPWERLGHAFLHTFFEQAPHAIRRLAENQRHRTREPKISNFAQNVKKQVLNAGTGTAPTEGQKVKVHYTVTLINGSPNRQLDSSRDRGNPLVFAIGRDKVIKGLDECVATMKVGERAKFTTSPDYAFDGCIPATQPVIPPNGTVVFDIELLDVE